MKKSGKLLTIGALMLAAAGSYFVSGTYAKYTSTVRGSDTATVAKWAWSQKVGTAEATALDLSNTKTFTFNLFDTINDTGDSADETDVADNKIAPGTAGHFDIVLINNSEVNAQYGIVYTVTNANNVPIEYSLDKTTWTSTLANVTAGTETAINMSESKTITVYWRWAFTGAGSTNFTESQTDTTDTALGIAAATTAPTVTVQADITMTQVD